MAAPRMTQEDVGGFYAGDDGSVWILVGYAAEPTATLERIYPALPVSEAILGHRIRRGGVVGAPIFDGLTRLVREAERLPEQYMVAVAFAPGRLRLLGVPEDAAVILGRGRGRHGPSATPVARDELGAVLAAANANLAREYRSGVADGMRTTLRLLLGQPTDGAPPFPGPLTPESEAWARAALERVEAERP